MDEQSLFIRPIPRFYPLLLTYGYSSSTLLYIFNFLSIGSFLSANMLSLVLIPSLKDHYFLWQYCNFIINVLINILRGRFFPLPLFLFLTEIIKNNCFLFENLIKFKLLEKVYFHTPEKYENSWFKCINESKD